MSLTEQFKQALNSGHDVEITIDTQNKADITIDVQNETAQGQLQKRRTRQKKLVAKPQSIEIQQDISRAAGKKFTPYHPLKTVQDETNYLNIIVSNRNAWKNYQKLEEENHTENLIWQTEQRLAGCHMLPLRYGLYEQPDIDWHLVPKNMSNIIKAVAEETGWNRFEILLIFLGSVAMAMRGRYVVKLDDLWEEVIILYQAIIASSGKRKSLIAKIFKSVFNQFIEEKQSEYLKDTSFIKEKQEAIRIVKYKLRRKAISKAIADAYDKDCGLDVYAAFSSLQGPIEELETIASEFEVHAGELPRFFAEHATFRGLLDLLSHQCAIALFGEEGNSFAEMLNTQGSSLDVFLKGYTMEDFTNDNARYGNTHLKKPVLNILFIVQDYIIRQIYKSQRLASVGVTPRFLHYFCSDESSRQDTVTGVAKESIAIYEDKIRRMLARNYTQDSEREIFSCSVETEAYGEIKRYEAVIASHVAEGQYKHMEPFLNKLHGTAVRLAGVIHAWNHEQPEQHPITHQEMLLGIQIADAHIAHASFAFDPTGTSAFYDAQKILAWVKRHGYGRFTSRDIAQGISNMTNANIHPALDLLEQHNILGQIIIPNRSRICVLHPHFFYHNRS